MANPQLENGHTRIANEILEALIAANLSGQEMSAALFVIRKTYGFGKKEDYISLSQFQTALNISKTRASQIVNSLQLKKILTVKENINGLTKKYIFNKYLKEWDIPLRKTVTVKEKRNNRSSISKKPLRKTLTTKEKTKETITKEIWMEKFLIFYKDYPNKKSKGYAEKAWLKLKPSKELFISVMEGLEKAKNSKEWNKDEGKYIPHPSTWLNAKGWEDEYKQKQERKFA